MIEANIRREFRSKNIEETANHFVAEIKENRLMSKKHKKVSVMLNYTFLF